MRQTVFRERSWETETQSKTLCFFSVSLLFLNALESKSPEKKLLLRHCCRRPLFYRKILLAMGKYCSVCKDLKIDW